jgi:3-oxoadipate enol-lactonase
MKNPLPSATSDSTEKRLSYEKANIHYRVSGEGEPVLLLHGGFLDLSMWDSQIDALIKAGFRVIRYSDIGHGKTESGTKQLLGCAIAKALLDTLGIQTINIVGLSWGARIAMDFALTYPEKMKRLVLVSPGLNGWNWGLDTLAGKNNEAMFKAMNSNDTLMIVEAFQRNWTDGPRRDKTKVNAAVRQTIAAMITNNLRRHWGEQWSREQRPPSGERLEKITCPTLLVKGECDVLDIIAIVDLLSKKLPDSRTVEIKGVAHTLTMEKPEEFNKAAIDFLKGGYNPGF